MSSWNAVIPILIKIQLTVFWLDRQMVQDISEVINLPEEQ